MISIKRLILASLFATGTAFGVLAFHGAAFHGASVTPSHLQLAGDGTPPPPAI